MAWMHGEYEVSEAVGQAVKWLVEEIMEKQRDGRVHVSVDGNYVEIKEPESAVKKEKKR